MLYEEFLDYLHRRGFKGVLVDTTSMDEYMHARHFLKRGFRVVHEYATGKLLYYPINQDSIWVEKTQPHVSREGGA